MNITESDFEKAININIHNGKAPKKCFELSQKMAEGFAQWILENRWSKDLNTGNWRKTYSHKVPDILTTSELFQEYLNQSK